jgi:hypothetical protein
MVSKRAVRLVFQKADLKELQKVELMDVMKVEMMVLKLVVRWAEKKAV